MENKVLTEEELNSLIDYYKKIGLLIIGMNDSQGVNTSSTFFKKGLLEHIVASLSSDYFTPNVINAFSLTMNKTEHIDYFLKNNLSMEEIKLSQVYSVVSALEKVMSDVGLPSFLGNVGNLYKLVYGIKKEDKNVKISTSLKQAKEPLVIYSSGVNDLMREVGANPFGIKNDYKKRFKRPNYYYTLDKVNNLNTLLGVMDSIEKNYDNIFSINPNTDIFTLGAYIPKSLQSEGMNIFRDLVIDYNEKLFELCSKYGVNFVDIEELGKEYNNSKINFHISSKGHKALADYILYNIYQKKIVDEVKKFYVRNNNFEISNDGANGVISSCMFDYEKCYANSKMLDGYSKERELEIAKEHLREVDVFKKVLCKRTKYK